MPRRPRSRKETTPPPVGEALVLQGIQPPAALPQDDPALRPATLDGFTGQAAAIRLLRMTLDGSMSRGECPDHILMHGPPGLGKTTLAQVVASELRAGFRPLSAASIAKPGDLAAALVTIQPGDVLFLDEIHRMPAVCCELLYGAMEDFRLDVLAGAGDGPSATIVSLPLPRFTLVGATTRPGMLPRPLRDRFGIDVRLEPYAPAELATIVTRSAGLLNGCPPLEAGIADQVAVRSRGTPRIANRLLRRLRDFAAHTGRAVLDHEAAMGAWTLLGIDADGLGERDRAYMACLRGRGRPVGLGTLAAALGEDPGTLEDEIEPWLVSRGLVDRTPQGRVPGPAAVPG
jgi:Holliday junction DNA helicase RuvB